MYCIFALVFVAASFATADPAPIQGEVDAVDIAPAELKSLQERRRLVRGSYQLHVKNYKGNTTEVAAEVEFHFWFDFSGVELMRQDEIHYSTSVTKAGSDGGQQPLELIGSDGRSVTRQVRRENELVHWSPDRFSDGSSVAATMSEIRFVNSGQLQSWIDPRVVGMTVNSFGHQYSQHLQSIIGYPGRTHLQATTFEFEGRQLDRIDYEISEDNVKVSVLLDAVKGWSPVFMEKSYPERNGSGNYVFTEARVDVAAVGSDMIWFPTRIQLRSYKKDGPTSDAIASSDTVKVNYHEDWTLSAIRLNDEIPDEVFTFKGMGLTKGTSVHILSDQPEFARVWNGNEVVIAELPSMPAPQVADLQPRRIRYLPAILAFNAIVFLIFGAVLVWKARNGKECK